MRLASTLSLIAAFTLVACGQSPDKDKGGSEDKRGSGITIPGGNLAVAEAGSDADFRVEPGRYRSTINVTNISLGGLPKEIAARMPRQQSFEYCVTPEQSAKGLEAIKHQMADGQCQFESFKASDGKVESVFTCNAKGGFAMKSSSHGTYTERGSQVAVVANAQLPGGHSMHIEETVKAERIGDCGK